MRPVDADRLIDELEEIHWYAVDPGTGVLHSGASSRDKEQYVKYGDVENLINGAETVGEWVSVDKAMPEEKETIFAKFKGTPKWRDAMFEKSSEDVRVVIRFEDGTRTVSHSGTIDGVWAIEKKPYPKCKVTHWIANPPLPEDAEE